MEKKIIKNNSLTFVSLATFLVLWEGLYRFEVINQNFIGAPTKILLELYLFFAEGYIFSHLIYSFEPFFIAFFLSVLMGSFLGIFVGSSTRIYSVFSPYIFAIHSTPKIALLPLIILWLGIGTPAKAMVIFLMAFVPIFISTVESTRNIDPRYLEMARSFHVSKFFLIKNIYFFDCLPAIFSGIKISLGRALTGMIVAGFFGLGEGLGYLISFYGATMQINKMLALIFFLLFTNFFLLAIIQKARQRLIRWKTK